VTLAYFLWMNKISLYRLSKDSGISYSTLYAICEGKICLENLRSSLLFSLSAALHMSMDDLYSMDRKRKTNTIPSWLYPFFWDTTPEKLNLEKNRNYIVTRLLNKGDIPEILWLKKEYTKEEIKEVALSSRDLDPVVANFLKDEFHLRKQEMKYYQMKPSVPWR